MKITILSVGSIKEKYLKEGILEYSKRISKYCKLDFISVGDEPISTGISEEEIKRREAQKLLSKLPENSYKIALNLRGEMLDSMELSAKISHIFSYYNSHIVFVIGGSLGLGEDVLKVMDYHLCFSKMTFPHQLMQVILLEQLFRSFKILNHETYHK